MCPHTALVLLRQSFFGLAWLAIIVAAFGVAFASQRDDFVVAIAHHLLRFGHLLGDDGSVLFDGVGLIDVRVTARRTHWNDSQMHF
jgi:hypothetical protein